MLPLALGLICLGGCLRAVHEEVDQQICRRAERLADIGPPEAQKKPQPETLPPPARLEKEPGGPAKTMVERLTVPPDVPGSWAPQIKLPPVEDRKAVEAAVNRYLPPLPPLGPDPLPAPGPGGQPLTLADLQRLALTNSPLLPAAYAEVKAAEGAARQAGAYPNPVAAFTAQSGTSGSGPNYGGFVSQTIKTANKLKLAQASALMDLENARLKLAKAQADLFSQVRQNYFAVLVARENVKANKALAVLTDEAFKILEIQLKLAGEVAMYEPMQLRVVALQARGALVQARNSYNTAWRQLAATLGLPAMPLTELAGRVDMSIPRYRYDQVLARVLGTHTEVLTAQNDIQKARYNLGSAQVTPIPDVSVQASVVKDYTPPGPPGTFAAVQVSVALPVWDLNKGNILQMQGNLLKAVEEPHQTRDELTSRVADAFGRYENGRILLEMYRKDILPNQVQAFRASVLRHSKAPELEKGQISFNDLIMAEQTLVTVVTTYLGALSDQWKAVVDVGALLQTDDLFQSSPDVYPVAAVPDLEHLLTLPCVHPCSPLPAGAYTGANGAWPPAAPAEWSRKDPASNQTSATSSPQNSLAMPSTAFSNGEAAQEPRPARLGAVIGLSHAGEEFSVIVGAGR
jgi:cobalt-zinc-cadmium efflux system outer membrane protein